MTEVPAQGTKRALCCVLAARGACAGQPCNRPLKDGRCHNHPAAPATEVPVVVTAAAVHAKARVVAHEALAVWRLGGDNRANAWATLRFRVADAIVAAIRVAMEEVDVEGQTPEQKNEKKEQHANAENDYWGAFI